MLQNGYLEILCDTKPKSTISNIKSKQPILKIIKRKKNIHTRITQGLYILPINNFTFMYS